MGTKTVQACLGMILGCMLAPVVWAQQSDDPMGRISPDTNSAVIEGRVTLPSGFSADTNIKITLKNTQSILSTLYSNKHGEFRFDTLSQGVYYVEAEVVGRELEPVVVKVMLGRGIVSELTIQLSDKVSSLAVRTPARVVSVAELRQSVPAGAKKEYNLGLKSVAKGDVKQAAGHFQEALVQYPDYLAARNDRGAQYLKLKLLDQAEADFRNVLERDPKNFNAKFNLGLVRIERHDYANAILQLNEAIVIDSSRPVARLWIGVALLELGDLPKAEAELTKALVMGGAECVAAQYHLARIYLSRGDAVAATRSVRAYLEASPKGEYVKEALELKKKIDEVKK